MNLRINLLILILIYLILISGIFWFYPGIDLWVSSLFWQAGQKFIYLNSPWFFWASWIRKILNFSVWACVFISLIGLFWKKYRKNCFYILFCFALAPGLITNVVLKNHWGQPRPVEIHNFGGDLNYQKDWVVSNQCPTNCSFVCGDCSAVFIFFAFVPLIKNRNKNKKNKIIKTLLAGIIIGASLLIGLIRLGQGGHFLSDVLLAYGIDGLVICLGVTSVLNYESIRAFEFFRRR